MQPSPNVTIFCPVLQKAQAHPETQQRMNLYFLGCKFQFIRRKVTPLSLSLVTLPHLFPLGFSVQVISHGGMFSPAQQLLPKTQFLPTWNSYFKKKPLSNGSVTFLPSLQCWVNTPSERRDFLLYHSGLGAEFKYSNTSNFLLYCPNQLQNKTLPPLCTFFSPLFQTIFVVQM